MLSRTLIAALAALSLTTVVFADENAAPVSASDTSAKTAAPQVVVADAQSTTQAAAPVAAPVAAATQQDNKVNLNTATAKELSKLKGLTNAKARAIVSYRKKHGEFKSLEDLKEVKGLKKMKPDQLKDLEDQLTLG
jgi:competence protein ComEA